MRPIVTPEANLVGGDNAKLRLVGASRWVENSRVGILHMGFYGGLDQVRFIRRQRPLDVRSVCFDSCSRGSGGNHQNARRKNRNASRIAVAPSLILAGLLHRQHLNRRLSTTIHSDT